MQWMIRQAIGCDLTLDLELEEILASTTPIFPSQHRVANSFNYDIDTSSPLLVGPRFHV